MSNNNDDNDEESSVEYEAYTYANIGLPSTQTPLEDRSHSPDSMFDTEVEYEGDCHHDNLPKFTACPAPNATRCIGVLSLDEPTTVFLNKETITNNDGTEQENNEWIVERMSFIGFISARDVGPCCGDHKLIDIRFHHHVLLSRGKVLPPTKMIFRTPYSWSKRVMLMLIQFSIGERTDDNRVISCTTCSCPFDNERNETGDINHIIFDYKHTNLETIKMLLHNYYTTHSINVTGGIK